MLLFQKRSLLTKKAKEDKQFKWLLYVTVAVSIVVSVAAFMLLPYALASLCRRVGASEFAVTIVEAFVKLALFMGYMLLISRMKDIQRTFMYHGAEHKCINCIEHGMPLTVENVRKSSRQHKRCGTSFLFFVMIVSIIFCLFYHSRIAGLKSRNPDCADAGDRGSSYEIIRLAGSSENPVVNVLSKPGMWVQMMTTKEPDDSMIEVAIRAVEEVFDWKAYLEENFSKTEESFGENKCTQEECAL